jgi:hypothetical protein
VAVIMVQDSMVAAPTVVVLSIGSWEDTDGVVPATEVVLGAGGIIIMMGLGMGIITMLVPVVPVVGGGSEERLKPKVLRRHHLRIMRLSGMEDGSVAGEDLMGRCSF